MSAEEQTYRASAFHPSLGNAMSEGVLSLDQWTLRFAGENLQLDFPLQDLQIHFSEFDNARVLFTHPTQPDWSVYTYETNILEHRAFSKRTELRLQLEQQTNPKSNLRKLLAITLGVFGSFMLMFMLLFWAGGLMVRFLVNKVPTSYEKQMGDAAFEEVKAENTFVEDPKTIAKLDALAAKLIPVKERAKYNFRFHIADDPDANAIALPGGNIVVTTGLLEMLQEPEELAGVLGHEIAHVTQRHALRQMVSNLGPYLMLRAFLGDDGSVLGTVGAGSVLLITQSFSQDFEFEADDVAWKYLTEARINPRGFIEGLKQLKARYGKLEQLEIQALSTHPATKARIEKLESKWKKLKQKSGFVELEPIAYKPVLH